jgi:hypothetical protein
MPEEEEGVMTMTRTVRGGDMGEPLRRRYLEPLTVPGEPVPEEEPLPVTEPAPALEPVPA